MGRWAEAFQTSIAKRDTADSADTSSAEKLSTGQSVISVSSVTQASEPECGPVASLAGLVSAVSAVSSQGTSWIETTAVAPMRPPADRLRAAAGELTRLIVDAHRGAALRCPPSWWRPAAHRPTPGTNCGCCSGRRWWSKDQRGWCCWTCHPPVHLSADAIQEVRT